MARASFDAEGDTGLLTVTTHFSDTVEIACEKQEDEIFRLGGTAVHEVMVYEGLVLKLPSLPPHAQFRAFRSEKHYFDGVGILSSEKWSDANRHCYITEFYPIDMEGKRPSWFISKRPIKNANHLFVNLDVLDGGGNLIKRYRVSPFTGEHKVMYV